MIARFRIGYPYACSDSSVIREAAVVLAPSRYPGFSTVSTRQGECRLVETDRGPRIIVGLSTGVQGYLLEPDDGRRSIGHGGRIIGQGVSMQLALVLAVFARYKDKESRDLPLLLLSGAVESPAGAPAFVDAVVRSYCSEREAKDSLLQKYRVARFAGALALVLPERDARILAQTLGKQWHAPEKILLRQSNTPVIIGVEKTGLPQLAKIIGISPYHYRQKKKLSRYVFILLACLPLTWVTWLAWHYFSPVKPIDKNEHVLDRGEAEAYGRKLQILLKRYPVNCKNFPPPPRGQSSKRWEAYLMEIEWRLKCEYLSQGIPRQSHKKGMRELTTQLLARLDGNSPVPFLVSALGDKNAQTRNLAAYMLRKLGVRATKAAPELAAAIESLDTRYNATTALIEIGEKAVPALLNIVKKGKRETAKAAVQTLGKIEISPMSAPILDDLLAILQSKRFSGRTGIEAKQMALRMLGELKTRDEVAVSLLLSFAKKGNITAIAALGKTRTLATPVTSVLITRLESNSPLQCEAAVSAFCDFGARAAPKLWEKFQDRKAGKSRRYAAQALSEMAPQLPQYAPSFTAALADGDPYIRIFAARALVRMDPDALAAVSLLVAELSDKGQSPTLRAQAAEALSFAGRAALPALLVAVDDEKAKVKVISARSLAMINPKIGLNKLIELLEDWNGNTRALAIEALGEMGNKAFPAIPALSKDLDDYRIWRNQALAKIISETDPKNTELFPTLISMLKPRYDDNVTTEARKSLARMGTAILPALSVALAKSENSFRENLIETFAEMGPKAKSAAPVLLKIIRNENEFWQTRIVAWIALWKTKH